MENKRKSMSCPYCGTASLCSDGVSFKSRLGHEMVEVAPSKCVWCKRRCELLFRQNGEFVRHYAKGVMV